MRVIRLADCPPVLWRNGAGSTRELWKLEDETGVLIRLSVAEITGDQPFSSFPGIDRVILQLDGPAMVLHVDGREQGIATPFAFPGEAGVSCRLSRPGIAHDLNLMVRRGAFQAGMEVISATGGQQIEIGTGPGLSALVALGPCRLTGAIDVGLGGHDMILATERDQVTAQGDGRFVRLAAKALPGR